MNKGIKTTIPSGFLAHLQFRLDPPNVQGLRTTLQPASAIDELHQPHETPP